VKKDCAPFSFRARRPSGSFARISKQHTIDEAIVPALAEPSERVLREELDNQKYDKCSKLGEPGEKVSIATE
jgi:hypothetical protein